MDVEAGQEVKMGIGRKTESKGVLIEAESGTGSEGGGNRQEMRTGDADRAESKEFVLG